jgi:ribonuclease P protein component
LQRPGTLAAPSRGRAAQGEARVTNGTVPDDRGSPTDSPAIERASQSSSFPKHRRIRRRSEFGTVFDGGTRLQGRFFTFLLLPNGLAGSRLGIVASRKFGGAVQRNRAKRLIREMFRQLGPQASSAAMDLVVIPRRELLTAEFTHIARDFGNTWRRAVERVAANRRG